MILSSLLGKSLAILLGSIILRYDYTLLLGIERSSWRDPLPEWGRSIISNGNLSHKTSRENQNDLNIIDEFSQSVWFSLLVLWVRSGSQFPVEIVHLPHSGRGSQQLLLSRTDYFVLNFRSVRLSVQLWELNTRTHWQMMSKLLHLLLMWGVKNNVTLTEFIRV